MFVKEIDFEKIRLCGIIKDFQNAFDSAHDMIIRLDMEINRLQSKIVELERKALLENSPECYSTHIEIQLSKSEINDIEDYKNDFRAALNGLTRLINSIESRQQ